MVGLSIVYLLFLAIVIVAMVVRDGLRGTEEFLSLRNFFLLGMLIFQVTGAAYNLSMPSSGKFIPSEPGSTSIIYSLMVTVFLVFFFVSGRAVTPRIDRVFSRRRRGTFRVSPIGLLLVSTSALLVGMLCQFVLSGVPFIGGGMLFMAFGLYAVAAGLATWVAAPRLINPAVVIPAVAIVLLCMALTFYKNFGRRDLLGVILAVMWAAYFARWRSLPPIQSLARLAVVSFLGVMLMFALTSVRQGAFRKGGMIANITALKNARISDGLADVLSGQAAAMASMWLIESRPDSREYDTLHSVRLAILMPIPRRLWPAKPMGLAQTMPQQEVYLANMPKDFNIGPGIIGHVENDNPWIALWLYPIILGVFIRVLDRSAAWCADNPFIVLPMGAAIGQFIGMPRGELGTFFFVGVINITASFLMMLVLYHLLKSIGVVGVDEGGLEDEAVGPTAADEMEHTHG